MSNLDPKSSIRLSQTKNLLVVLLNFGSRYTNQSTQTAMCYFSEIVVSGLYFDKPDLFQSY